MLCLRDIFQSLLSRYLHIYEHGLHLKEIIEGSTYLFQLHVAQFSPVLKQYDNRSE